MYYAIYYVLYTGTIYNIIGIGFICIESQVTSYNGNNHTTDVKSQYSSI